MMLMIPKGYETAAPGTMPDAKAVEAMMKYNEALQKAGILVALDGLHPPFTARECPSLKANPRSPTVRSRKRKRSLALLDDPGQFQG